MRGDDAANDGTAEINGKGHQRLRCKISEQRTIAGQSPLEEVADDRRIGAREDHRHDPWDTERPAAATPESCERQGRWRHPLPRSRRGQ